MEIDDELSFMVIEEDAELEEIVVTGYTPSPNRRRQNSNISEIQSGSSLTFSSTLDLKKWESNAEYMSDLKCADAKDLYAEYMKLKSANEDNPSFYFDVATYMFQKSQR